MVTYYDTIENWKKALDLGNVIAKYNLGCFYSQDEEHVHLEQAKKYLLEAISVKFLPAYIVLVKCYSKEIDITKFFRICQ
jgi:hypothetical protein